MIYGYFLIGYYLGTIDLGFLINYATLKILISIWKSNCPERLEKKSPKPENGIISLLPTAVLFFCFFYFLFDRRECKRMES